MPLGICLLSIKNGLLLRLLLRSEPLLHFKVLEACLLCQFSESKLLPTYTGLLTTYTGLLRPYPGLLTTYSGLLCPKLTC